MPQTVTMHEEIALVQRIRALSRPLHPASTGVRPRVRPIPEIKAILFDVYGTMLISGAGDIGTGSGDIKAREFRVALETVGLHPGKGKSVALGVARLEKAIRRAQRCRREDGIAFPEINIELVWRDIVTSLWHEHRVDGRLERGRIRRLAIEYECRVNPIWPMPGLSDVLPRLKAGGLILGIVSNAQFFTPLALTAFPETGWTSGLFDKRLCAWSYRWKEAKPSSRMLKAILYRLARYHGITPGETLVVGNDMRNDILPASRLGCPTALFAGDARSLRWRAEKPECRAVTPSLILTRMAQLPKAMDKSM